MPVELSSPLPRLSKVEEIMKRWHGLNKDITEQIVLTEKHRNFLDYTDRH